jgi:hypothetical protein
MSHTNMKTPILHPTKRHPLTGKPLEAVGVLPSGRIVWPILGGDDTVPPVERPEDITEDVWDALGDPGKAALVREREARQEAERQLAAARAPKPTPPKNPPAPTPPAPKATPPATPDPGDQPDIAAIVQQAVTEAIKPFQEAEERRTAQEAAREIVGAVTTAAKDKFHDPSDAVANIDLTKVVNDQGIADADKIKAELDAVLQRKPHLAKGPRIAPPGIGGGAPAVATDAEKVKAILADMQRATGLRIPSSNTH